MKCYFTFTRSKLFALLASVAVFALIALQFFGASADSAPDGSTNAKRLEYISGLSAPETEEEYTEKLITVPTEFSDVYEQYNKLQKKAGFDLKKYSGENLVCYSYKFRLSDGAVNLLVYNGRIVGGDIADYSANGVMLPLCRINGDTNGKTTT